MIVESNVILPRSSRPPPTGPLQQQTSAAADPVTTSGAAPHGCPLALAPSSASTQHSSHHQQQQQQQQQQSSSSSLSLLSATAWSSLNSGGAEDGCSCCDSLNALSAPPNSLSGKKRASAASSSLSSCFSSSTSPSSSSSSGSPKEGAGGSYGRGDGCGGGGGGGAYGNISPLRVELPTTLEDDDDSVGFSLKGYGEDDGRRGGRGGEEGAPPIGMEGSELGSCCFDADDIIMAGDDQRAEKYIVDIPFSVLLNIYQSLDADKGWEKLAAETGYSFDKIRLLELEGSRTQGSPSRSLLWELGSRNTTVRQLYSRLSNLGRYREMKILEDYVNIPSNPSFGDNGLKGLPDVSMDMSNSLKGLKSPVSKKTNTSTSTSNNNSVNSINFNRQQASSSDVNISMKCQQTDKYYPGKQMPFSSPSSSTTSTSAISKTDAAKTPSSIMAPMMKPTNPGTQCLPGPSNVNLVQNMIRQMPGGLSTSGPTSSSSTSLGRAPSQNQTSSPSSSSSPLCETPFSSSMSSLPGLESSFDVQMAFMGSASFSYSEVVQATGGFSERNKLGEGAFGKVYFGVLRNNKCAVKKMAEADGQETVVERSTQIKRELTSLLKFRHENIVTLYGYAVEGESLCLIYQFMPNGSLEDRLLCKKNTAPLVWSQRLNILLGACQGLNFLHTMGEQPLIHGDIKSANILLDKHMEAKIGDLGQAQQANGREGGSTTSRLTHITRAQATTKLYGTRAYQPREVQTGSRPSTKSDVFAMGVVLLEVFSGEKAFDERREGEHFLAEYFRSLKGESGDEACLSKVDRRGGECPREVCQAILSIADVCTSHLKRHRPDSSQLLQKMTEADELFTQKTGIKHLGMESLPGSEHSCHMSHSSSAGASVPNLTGAPPHSMPPHSSLPPKPSNNFSVNVNKDHPTEKHYAMHLPHEKPDNCLIVNVNSGPSSCPDASTSRQQSQSPVLSSSNHSPIDYFQKGQPLPPAFRLQQAYDSQSERERRRISRLSQCQPTKETVQCGDGVDTEILLQPDPAKLAALEQFDQENLHGRFEEKESNSFQSDPKKLAALKQFDDQVRHAQVQEDLAHTQHKAFLQKNNLASDPEKLAQLRLFDNSNVTTSSDCLNQRQEDNVLPSDPRKLAALTQFDAANSVPHALPSTPSVADSDPHKLAALNQFDAANSMSGPCSSLTFAQTRVRENHCAQGTFPVSTLDYVVSSQKEAMEACVSTDDHQQAVTPLPYSLSASHRSESVAATHSVGHSCQEESSVASASSQMQVPAQVTAPGSSNETLLRRQKDFFDLYSKALEGADEEEEEFDEANDDFENEDVEENENNYAVNVSQASYPGGAYTTSVQGQVGGGRLDGHCHPIPIEQDESAVLNYFKQKEKHYEKTFNKPQASQC
ncbi:uncharacterized protein LOC143284709 [Babylonia areolata]|uniref:uncharacterized protein LOC143284709 n=1 Tax=Babylonia areolata TaxID=304850 RepID=UPI003FD22F66